MGKFEEIYESFMNESVRLGNTYKIQLLAPTSGKIHKKVKPTEKDVVEQYEIENKPDAQLYKSVLKVYKDGRAVNEVNYVNYSGVKNKYKTYYDKDGKEIVDVSEKKEKEYFDSLVESLNKPSKDVKIIDMILANTDLDSENDHVFQIHKAVVDKDIKKVVELLEKAELDVETSRNLAKALMKI